MSNQERNAGNAGNRVNVIFWEMFPNFLGNVVKHSGERPQTTQRIFENNLGLVVKHSVESMKSFGCTYIIVLDTGDKLYLFAEEV